MLSDRLAMKKQTECTRAQCAAEHLKRVAALTGAKQDDDGTYHLTAGGTHFLVDAKFVPVVSPAPNRRAFLLRRTSRCRARTWWRLHCWRGERARKREG